MFIVYITCSSTKEAKKIATVLVKEKLAACCNWFKSNSVYEWRGKLVNTPEIILIAKSNNKKFPALEKRVKELHSYENPCVVAFKITRGRKQYLGWLKDSLV